MFLLSWTNTTAMGIHFPSWIISSSITYSNLRFLTIQTNGPTTPIESEWLHPFHFSYFFRLYMLPKAPHSFDGTLFIGCSNYNVTRILFFLKHYETVISFFCSKYMKILMGLPLSETLPLLWNLSLIFSYGIECCLFPHHERHPCHKTNQRD